MFGFKKRYTVLKKMYKTKKMFDLKKMYKKRTAQKKNFGFGKDTQSKKDMQLKKGLRKDAHRRHMVSTERKKNTNCTGSAERTDFVICKGRQCQERNTSAKG